MRGSLRGVVVRAAPGSHASYLPQVDIASLNSLMEEMSPELRSQVVLGTNSWIMEVPFFAALPHSVLFQLSGQMQQCTYPPGEAIFDVGDWGETLFIIRKGLVASNGRLLTTGKVATPARSAQTARYTGWSVPTPSPHAPGANACLIDRPADPGGRLPVPSAPDDV